MSDKSYILRAGKKYEVFIFRKGMYENVNFYNGISPKIKTRSPKSRNPHWCSRIVIAPMAENGLITLFTTHWHLTQKSSS